MKISSSGPKWKEVPGWLRVVGIVAFINFTTFWIVAVLNGGDAVNGGEKGGRYFLASHGRYTEVSKAFFDYSRIHAISIWITHAAAFLGFFLFLWLKKKDPQSHDPTPPHAPP